MRNNEGWLPWISRPSSYSVFGIAVERSHNPSTYFTTPKVNVVVECMVSPGRRTVLGKSGWFGESGKCCVSRQKPACFSYLMPCRPVKLPSRKLPE